MPACHFVGSRCSYARCISTEREEDPESIQTSRVSLDLVAAAGPDQLAGRTAFHNSAADFSNHTFEPCCSTRLATLRTTAASRMAWPAASKNAESGTPQVRWREMHQSGRDLTAASMRLFPQSGTQLTASIAARAFSRKRS